MSKIEKDELTGVETTGHEWDGVKELNTPLPTWWVYTYWACVIWAIGYWAVYPSWPTFSDYAKGYFNYSSRAQLDDTMAKVRESQSAWIGKFESATVEQIEADPELLTYAMAGGKVIFGDNCAPCHGAAGSGAPGYPVLADDDWLWGGKVTDIEQTIRYGIRSGHDQMRDNTMPGFAAEEILEPDDIAAAADHVLFLSGQGAASEQGAVVFADNCAACHGEEGEGVPDMGGPRLKDGIWLYGGSKDAVMAQISQPKHGVMPAWEGRLNDTSIKQAAVYVHSLGGGQ